MTFKVTLTKVSSGATLSTGTIPDNTEIEGYVNSYIARNPDNLSVIMKNVSEAQLRGLMYHVVAIDNALDTSSVETAVKAIMDD